MLQQTNTKSAEYRDYACKITRTTYKRLMTTPRSEPETIYAWRENEDIRVSLPLVGRVPATNIYGAAEGQNLIIPLFGQVHGWKPDDFLTDDEKQNAEKAAEEIRLRNLCEYRRLKSNAIADLLRKERAAKDDAN